MHPPGVMTLLQSQVGLCTTPAHVMFCIKKKGPVMCRVLEAMSERYGPALSIEIEPLAAAPTHPLPGSRKSLDTSPASLVACKARQTSSPYFGETTQASSDISGRGLSRHNREARDALQLSHRLSSPFDQRSLNIGKQGIRQALTHIAKPL